MTSTPLHPARENIGRAKRKFQELKSEINNYLGKKPFSIHTRKRAGMVFLIGRVDCDPPKDIAFDAVEIVNRLRNALDKAVCALVENNGRCLSGVGFPFGSLDNSTNLAAPFPSQSQMKTVRKKLTDEQWRVILDSKPYYGGSNILWSINQIANVDKHRTKLVTVSGAVGSSHFSLNRGDGTQSFHLNPDPAQFTMRIDAEKEKVIMAYDAGTGNFVANQEFQTEVVFGPINPVQGQNVLTVINQQIRLVDNLISKMAPFFR